MYCMPCTTQASNPLQAPSQPGPCALQCPALAKQASSRGPHHHRQSPGGCVCMRRFVTRTQLFDIPGKGPGRTARPRSRRPASPQRASAALTQRAHQAPQHQVRGTGPQAWGLRQDWQAGKATDQLHPQRGRCASSRASATSPCAHAGQRELPRACLHCLCRSAHSTGPRHA